MKYIYKNKEYEVSVGPKGGYFIMVNNVKKYVKINTSKANPKKENNRIYNTSSNKKYKTTRRNNINDEVPSHIKRCCCCGKQLTSTDIHYYDLTDYCIDCAIKDGIRTSKE